MLKSLGEFDDDILKLAKLHRMSTDARRSVFAVFMTSEDFMDAFEKLNRLNLKSKQDRDIVSVLLYCCQQENTYNPFYGHLALKLCSFNKNITFTLKVSFWDIMKTLQDPQDTTLVPLKISNLAHLLAQLVGSQQMPLVIFKPLTVLDMTAKSLLFFRVVFDSIFLEFSEEEIIQIFFAKVNNINQKKIKEELREQIIGFLIQYTKNRKTKQNIKNKEKHSKILYLAKVAKKALRQVPT